MRLEISNQEINMMEAENNVTVIISMKKEKNHIGCSYCCSGVTHNCNTKDNTKSNWCTAYSYCSHCPNNMTRECL